MPPDSAWSDQFNKSEIQLNLRGIGWKNFVKQCLTETDIVKKNENRNNVALSYDPNLVMNIRHNMIKQCRKPSPTPQTQIYTEAFKLLREEYHNRLLKHKQVKLVDTEIEKLNQIFQNRRLSIQKKLQQSSEKSESQKSVKCNKKSSKGFEYCDAVRKLDPWLGSPVQVIVEPRVSRETLVSVKKTREQAEEERNVPSRKGSMKSIIEDEDARDSQFWDSEQGKNEIMKKFFERNSYMNHHHEYGDVPKEKVDTKNELEVQKINENSIARASSLAKNLTQYKTRKMRRKICEDKIEAFFSRLRDLRLKEEKERKLRVGNRVSSKKEERSNKLSKETTRKCDKADNEKDEKLKKLMQEINLSQKEAYRKLREARLSSEIQIKFPDPKFLLRMHERREERMKRRKEIQEKKRQLEEEKENTQKEREEQEKRKRLEDIREKRRLDKEKKEEQKREMENVRLNLRLAANHYRGYLLRSHGLRPWMQLVRLSQWQHEKADSFFERRLQQRVLHKWMAFVRDQLELKVRGAVALHERILKRKCLGMWMESHTAKIRQHQAAVDWYDFRITENAFKRWLEFTRTEHSEFMKKKEMAVVHYVRKLKWKCLQILKDYPELKRLEQAKENRKWKWRQKVKEILPDYEPVDIENF